MAQAKAERVEMTKDDFTQVPHTDIYWLGGGGAMINSRGTVIMIDPLLKGFDMKILTEAPLTTDVVPHVDATIITHCDNDHFSRDTLADLKDRTDEHHAPHYVASLFKELGIDAKGHDIGESFKVNDVTITLTPAWHNWQNDSPKHSKVRYYAMEDYCGYRIDTPDGSIWMPGDSRLLEEQLHFAPMDVMLMDISDSKWHIGLPGVEKLAAAYPDTVLLPIHWGSVDAPDWKEFNGDPQVVKDMIVNPDRLKVVAIGEKYTLK